MLTIYLAKHYSHIDFLKRQGHIKNYRRDEFISIIILKCKDVYIDDLTFFCSSQLKPIIVFAKSHGLDVNYLVYNMYTKYGYCTST